MSLAMVASGPGQVNLVRADLCFAQVGGFCFQTGPRDMHPAGIADKLYPLWKAHSKS